MAGCLLMMGLASCEMKEEILGNKNDSGEMGVLNLCVVVDAKSNDIVTKAGGTEDSGEINVPAVSTKGYEVEISDSEGLLYKTVTYDPENTAVELPVGDYTIYAHAPGDAKETEAYYGGRTSLKVEKDKPVDAAVTCKMMNTKIQLTYTTEMQASFKSWDITVTAGNKNKLIKYDGTNFVEQPDAFFWMLEEGTKEISISFVGTNTDNKTVRDTRVITKPASAEDSDWLGGDVLQIDLKPGTTDPDNPSGVSGIEIGAEVKWDGVEDSVDATVDDEGSEEPTDPEQPEVGAPTITGDCIGKELTYVAGGEALNIAVNMNVPGKIQDVKVQIGSSNEDFEEALSGMGLTVAGGSSLFTNEILQNMNLFPLPKEGDSTYDFSLSETLLGMLANFPGTHTFQLIVEDKAGKSANASFKITIEEAQ